MASTAINRARALKQFPNPYRATAISAVSFVRYQFNPRGYITDMLKWQPWSGTAQAPGQVQVIDAYTLALRQQFERRYYEAGNTYDANAWQPGQTIQNWIRIEAGHSVGKTKIAAGLVSHFFDCFPPAIIYCFAPGYDQVNDLLFKEIRNDRRAQNLPGRVLDTPEIKLAGNHFAKGRATNDAHGKGTERTQGQHGQYLMFVLDEAEGIADFVFDAIESMASGGIVIVLMLANPRTRSSRFYKSRSRANTATFRISCISHPNVIQDREIVPGAVRRDYVLTMLADHCQAVEQHNADQYTFELPWQPGVIYQPDAEFMFRVLGVAPANVADKTLVTVGQYEAATRRIVEHAGTATIRMGADVARFGSDFGTLYIEFGFVVWRAAQFAQADTTTYVQRIKDEALAIKLARCEIVEQHDHDKQTFEVSGVIYLPGPDAPTSLHIRVDGGGGFGGGVIDQLQRDADLIAAFADFQVLEVHNNGTPYTPDAYADLVTELYAAAGLRLPALAIKNPPPALEADLCERLYDWTIKGGRTVRVLEEKKAFRKRLRRSPDDGDGFVLCVAPDHVFGRAVLWGFG